MIPYTIYNKTTGLIRKSFFAATSDSLGNYYNSETEAVTVSYTHLTLPTKRIV